VRLTQAGQTCLHAPLKAEFELPIPLDRGRELVTLEDAARYIQKLPKAETALAARRQIPTGRPTSATS
jgi:hypothetical protein